MRTLAQTVVFCTLVAACSPASSPPVDTNASPPGNGSDGSSGTTSTTAPRDCVRVTGGSSPIATGGPGTDALHISGELFVCADDVVIARANDLNALAAGAQLAAALDGPLLLPHPQLAAEIGRLKPRRVHVLGDIEIAVPPEAELIRYTMTEAVDAAKAALGVSQEVRLPAIPDASTIVETVNAIALGDRVVFPQTSPSTSTTAPDPPIDTEAVILGLATPHDGPLVWMVDAADPVTILTAAGSSHVVGAAVTAYDSANVLAYPELGTALSGRTPDQIRFIGAAPDTGEWELRVLLSGVQLPGGGYSILGDNQPKRYVAFYGHPSTPALGVLGEQGPAATLERMGPFLTDYQADGHQTIPTFEMLASVASAVPTDGDYSAETPISTLAPWVEYAAEHGGYVILDLQPGRDDFLTQAKQYEELLLLPYVGLALDPEWRLGPNQVHLQQTGRVEAEEVNSVVDWLADLVHDNGLPQKMIIVHQFRDFMIQNRSTLKERPELQMVIQMDGQGPIDTKDQTWAYLTAGTEDNHWSWGWKNFFDEDSPMPTPEHTMGKVPVPVFVSYQ